MFYSTSTTTTWDRLCFLSVSGFSFFFIPTQIYMVCVFFSYQFWIDMVWVRFRNIIFLAINTLVLTPNWDLTSTLSICPISWAKDFALGFCPERSSTFWIVSHFYFSDSFVVGDVFSVTRKKKQNWKDVIIMFKVRPYVYVSGGLVWYCFQRLCCNTIAGTQTRQAAWDGTFNRK